MKAPVNVYEQDKRIDNHYKNLLTYTAQEMQLHPELMEDWLEVLWALRSIERVGDRCKNICEYVVYLARGSDVRHAPFENIQKKIEDLT